MIRRGVRVRWAVVRPIAVLVGFVLAFLAGVQWQASGQPRPEVVMEQLLDAAPAHAVKYDFTLDDLDAFAEWWQGRGFGLARVPYEGWLLTIGPIPEGIHVLGEGPGPDSLKGRHRDQVRVEVAPRSILAKLHAWLQ